MHALRGNASVQQTAWPLLSRVSQEEITSSMKLCREVGHRSSRASAVIWHIVTARPQMRNCCFDYAFSITRDRDCSVVWWKGCCVQKEHTMFWEKNQAVKSGLLPAPWGEGPYNQLLCFVQFFIVLALCCWVTQKLCFTKGHHFSLQLTGEMEVSKYGCRYLHWNKLYGWASRSLCTITSLLPAGQPH